MSALQAIAAGRLLARVKAPYFRAVLMALAPVEAPGLGTIGVTERGVLMYDPDFVTRRTSDEMAGLLVHEVLHLVLRHAARGQAAGRDPRLANVADDLAINPTIVAMGLTLPEGGLFPAQFGFPTGLTSDAYYQLLTQREEQKREQEQASQGEQGNKSEQEQGSQGEQDGERQDSNSQDKSAQGDKPCTGGGHCGSCAGRAMPGEPSEGDAASRSEAEMGRVMRATAEAVREHAAGKGSLPAGLLRAAEAIVAPAKIDWRAKLARITRNAVAWRAGAVDYRYDAPSRRQAGLGYGAGRPVLPRLRAPMPEVMLLIDTSGSMSASDLSSAVSEAQGVLRAIGARATLATCDATLQGLRQVQDARDIVRALKGGGGTDLRPAFEAAAKLARRPEVVIAITDGLVGDGVPRAAPAGMRVVWVGVGPSRRRPATWGEYVEVEK